MVLRRGASSKAKTLLTCELEARPKPVGPTPRAGHPAPVECPEFRLSNVGWPFFPVLGVKALQGKLIFRSCWNPKF